MSSTPTGPPPIPPTKPTLSSPGSYMSTFQSGTITAGIHSSNKTHEKPAIAARPIPPPTLPKYSSSFNKIDRDRNDFAGGKIDRLERDKVRIFLKMIFSHWNLFFYYKIFIFITMRNRFTDQFKQHKKLFRINFTFYAGEWTVKDIYKTHTNRLLTSQTIHFLKYYLKEF